MKKQKRSQEILEADLTPMIDVTFQLIAFFMFLINFSEVDRAEEILLPSAQLAKPPEVRPEYQIILNLEPNGDVTFEGQRIQLELLAPIFNSQISSAQREGVAEKDIAVIIRSHKNTPTGVVQKLISKCQQAELTNFALRVMEKIH